MAKNSNPALEFLIRIGTESLNSDLKKAKKEVTDFEGAAKKSFKEAGDAIEKSAQSVKTSSAAYQKHLNEVGKSADHVASKLSNLDGSVKGRSFFDVKGSVGAAAKHFDFLGKTIENLKNPISKTADIFTTMGKKIAASIQQTFSFSLEDAGKKLDDIKSKSKAVVGEAAKAFLGLSAAVAIPLKTFADYESTLNRFNSVVERTGNDIEKLDVVAKKLGATTQFSAKQVGSAAVELAKLGFTTNKVIAALPGIVSAAAASQIELAEAAEIVVAALNGFQLEASEAGKIADLFSVAAARSAIDFRDLGETFKYVSSIANASNQNIEEMTALIAIMGNNMIKGSQAGTTLRTALSRLQAPARKARDVLSVLDINIKDEQTGKMRSLVDILKDMKVAFAGVDETTRNAAVATIFGQEALSGMVALLNQTPEQLDSMVASMNNVEGAAADMANIAFKGVNAELALLKSALETAAISFGEELAPAATLALEKMQEWLGVINEIPGSMKGALAEVLLFSAGIAGLTLALGATTLAVATLGKGLVAFAGFTGLAKVAVAAKALAVKVATAAMAEYTVQSMITNRATAALAATATGAGTAFVGMGAAIKTAMLGVIRILPYVAALAAAIGQVKKSLEDLKEAEMKDDALTDQLKLDNKVFKNIREVNEKIDAARKKDPNKPLWEILTPNEMRQAATYYKKMADEQAKLGNTEKQQSLMKMRNSYLNLANGVDGASQSISKMITLQEKLTDLQSKFKAAKLQADKDALQGQIRQAQREYDALDKSLATNPFVDQKRYGFLKTRGVQLNEDLMKDLQDAYAPDASANTTDPRIKALKDKFNAEKQNLGVMKQQLEIQALQTQEIKDQIEWENQYSKAKLKTSQVQKQLTSEEEKALLSKIKFKPAASGNFTPTSGRNINQIVMHHTAGGSKSFGESSYSHFFRGGGKKVSAHYIINEDGSIVQAVQDKDIAHHAWSSNQNSIGIEHVSRSLGNGQYTGMTPEQEKSSVALVKMLQKKYSIPTENIIPHKIASKGHTACPGNLFDKAGGLEAWKKKALLQQTPVLDGVDHGDHAADHYQGEEIEVPVKKSGIPPQLKASENVVNSIKKEEGFRASAYWDVDSPSVGYGSKTMFSRGGRATRMSDRVTKEEADKNLRAYLTGAEKAIYKLQGEMQEKKPGFAFNQNQFDALISFFYNAGNYAMDTPGRALHIGNAFRSGDIQGALKKMLGYGAHQGLGARRKREVDLFNTPVSGDQQTTQQSEFKIDEKAHSEKKALFEKSLQQFNDYKTKAMASIEQLKKYEAEALALGTEEGNQLATQFKNDRLQLEKELEEGLRKHNQNLRQLSQEEQMLLEQRKQQLLQNQIEQQNIINSFGADVQGKLEALRKSNRQRGMTQDEKEKDDAIEELNALEAKLKQVEAGLAKADLSDAARESLEEQKKNLSATIKTYSDEVFKSIDDAAARRAEDRSDRSLQMDIDEGMQRVQSEIKEDPTRIKPYQEKVKLLKQQLGLMEKATAEEKLQPEYKKKYADLQEKIFYAELDLAMFDSEAIKSLDEKIKLTREWEQAFLPVSQTVREISKTFSQIFGMIGNITASIVGAFDDKAGKELKGVVDVATGIADTIEGVFKAIEDGEDIWAMIGKAGLAVLQGVGSTVGSVMGMFPNEKAIEAASREFERSIIRADMEIEKTRLEMKLQAGETSLNEYYDEMTRINKEETAQMLQEIEDAMNTAIEQESSGFWNWLSKMFTGEITQESKDKIDQITQSAGKQKDQTQADSEAQAQQRRLEKEQRITESLARADKLRAENSVLAANKSGRIFDQIVADGEAKLQDLEARKDAVEKDFGEGKITKSEYVQQLANIEGQKDQVLADSQKSWKEHLQYINQLQADNTEAEINLKKTGLEKRIALEDHATERSLIDTRDRLKELEDLELTWTDEYTALKEKETNALAASNQRKLQLEREYQQQVQGLRLDLAEATASLTASGVDDLAVQRDQQLLSITQWKDQMMQEFPELADLINEIFTKRSAQAYRDFDEGLDSVAVSVANAQREVLALEAEATGSHLDQIQRNYKNTLGEIHDEEQQALRSYKLTEEQKTQATRKANALRLKAQQQYYDDLAAMAKDQLNEVKELRELIFMADTEEYRDMITQYESDIRKLDLSIREQEARLRAIQLEAQKERQQFKENDLASFEEGQSKINLQEQVREALKFAGINITDVANENAALDTRIESVEEYVQYLEEKAEDLFTLRDITEEEKVARQKEAVLLQAAFAQSQEAEVAERYAKEIAALQALGKSEEEIDLTRQSQLKEEQKLRKIYAEAFRRYQELEINAIDAREAANSEAINKEVESLKNKKESYEILMEEQKIIVDGFRIKYEEDLAVIDQKVREIEDAHKDWNFTIDQVRNNFSGTVDSIIQEYNRLKNNVGDMNFDVSAGFTGSGSSGSGSTSGSTSISRVANTGQSTPPSGYTVTDGDYWYKTTSQMYSAQATGLAEGLMIPNKPKYKGDKAGPFMLDAGELTLSQRNTSSLMDNVSLLPQIFQHLLQSTQTGGNNSFQIYPIIRDSSDIAKLEGMVNRIIETRETRNAARTWGYMVR